MSLIIYIEGNIGAGKSTVLHELTKLCDSNRCFIQTECVSNWPSLKLFYENRKKYAFQLQTEVLDSFHRREIECEQKEVYIFERSPFSSVNVFATLNCEPNSLEKLKSMALNKGLAAHKPFTRTLYIYLRTSVDLCMKHILERKKSTDKYIDIDYLKLLETKHDQVFIKKDARIMKTYVMVNGNQTREAVLADIFEIIQKYTDINII